MLAAYYKDLVCSSIMQSVTGTICSYFVDLLSGDQEKAIKSAAILALDTSQHSKGSLCADSVSWLLLLICNNNACSCGGKLNLRLFTGFCRKYYVLWRTSCLLPLLTIHKFQGAEKFSLFPQYNFTFKSPHADCILGKIHVLSYLSNYRKSFPPLLPPFPPSVSLPLPPISSFPLEHYFTYLRQSYGIDLLRGAEKLQDTVLFPASRWLFLHRFLFWAHPLSFHGLCQFHKIPWSLLIQNSATVYVSFLLEGKKLICFPEYFSIAAHWETALSGYLCTQNARVPGLPVLCPVWHDIAHQSQCDFHRFDDPDGNQAFCVDTLAVLLLPLSLDSNG